MAIELELKAVLTDPARFRTVLRSLGAEECFRGMLRDRRYDRAGELDGRDQVLRLRRWIPAAGEERAELGWKGPTTVNAAGYKHREEIECAVGGGAAAAHLLEALGYRESHAIDRYVEVARLAGAVARLEWYPRMDVLLEIEGEPESIEQLIARAGLPREACLPDALVQFTDRYAQRTGRRAILSEAELGTEPPTWSQV